MTDQATTEPSTLLKALDWAYEQALAGIPKLHIESAAELADSYRAKSSSTDDAARRLIRWQMSKAGVSGFVTGLGGFITMPVGIPVNLASVLLVQLRMIAAVAHIGGHDVHDDQVRAMAYGCMYGNAAADIVKDVGIQLGVKLAQQGVKKISAEAIRKLNQKVGFRLLTKFGQKGILNFGKLVPIAGGFVGGAFDAGSTYAVGAVARRMFIGRH